MKYPLQAIATAMLPDRVFQNQVPADDPRDQLPQRRVRIGVGASRLRNHRRQLGVAQRREPADDAEQDEREDQRRAGAVADDFAARQRLAGGRGADRREDARADDGADRQHDQIARAEHALQRVRAVGDQTRRSACVETADSWLGSQTVVETVKTIRRTARNQAFRAARVPTGTDSLNTVSLEARTSPPRGSNASPMQRAAGDHLLDLGPAIETHAVDAARARERVHDVQIALRIERQPLRPAEAVVEHLDQPVGRDAVHAVARAERRGRHVQPAVGAEREVKRGDARRDARERPSRSRRARGESIRIDRRRRACRPARTRCRTRRRDRSRPS